MGWANMIEGVEDSGVVIFPKVPKGDKEDSVPLEGIGVSGVRSEVAGQPFMKGTVEGEAEGRGGLILTQTS